MNPLFILSQPRSGSTLLQRLLGAHPEIATTSECWFLLPLVSIWAARGVQSYYGSRTASKAIKEMFLSPEDAFGAYNEAAHDFAMKIYGASVKHVSAKYFLDKTPRYYSIIDEISAIFPEAKFIFLFRNPLAVLASMIEAFGHGRLKHMHAYVEDVLTAPLSLVNSLEKYSARSQCICYESLIKDPRQVLEKVTEFLELPFDEKMLKSFSFVDLKGSFGDDKGILQYGNKIESQSISSWKVTLNNPVRKILARLMLKRISRPILKKMGYNHDVLMNDLKANCGQDFCSYFHIVTLCDFWDLLLCQLKRATNASILREKRLYKRVFGVYPYLQ